MRLFPGNASLPALHLSPARHFWFVCNICRRVSRIQVVFFTFRRNWRVEHGRSPANRADAETILCDLLTRRIILTRPELEKIKLDLPKPSGRSAQILKDKTEKARQITANKYFKYDAEDQSSFNTRDILLDAPRSRLNEIAKTYKITGYTKMNEWTLATEIAKLPDIETILIELITKYRHYELAEEDIKYLKSLRYKRHKLGEDEQGQ